MCSAFIALNNDIGERIFDILGHFEIVIGVVWVGAALDLLSVIHAPVVRVDVCWVG